MLRFLQAHATHPEPELALEMVWAQLASQMAVPGGTASPWLPAGEPGRDAPTLGWCYISDDLAHGAQAVLDGLRQRMPQVAWVGAVGAGVLASHVEYMDEPALVVMLCNLPREDFRIFHGRQPLHALPRGRRHLPDASLGGNPGWRAHTALVHADARTPDLPELIAEMASRTDTGYLFGGLSASQHHPLHMALAPEDATAPPSTAPAATQHTAGVWHGGLSGVAFGERVRLVSRVSQGCSPVGPRREITLAERNVIYELDGEPALACLLRDLGVTATVSGSGWQREALPKVRATLAGLSDAASDLLSHGRHFGADTRVRHIIGLDPGRQGVALAEEVEVGMQMAFCQRNAQAARQDLVRICAEIREEFDPQEHPGSQAAGAIYISCAGRGGGHFGAPNAEMEILAHALGDIPVVGFFAGGEIARHHLYGYTGVLTVFGA
ncbi:FIST N-terminal domain-containing protein [uncultured Aquabacterium sp.]|uniref:FIST signal transduction protein n=1 Tax=Aquabacterium commune TaxID=70586 RepID=UPI0030CE3E8F